MEVSVIPTDKLLHFLIGAVIGFVVTASFGSIAAIIAITIAAAGKELYDKYHPDHTVDLYDAVATVTGGILAIIWMYLTYTL